MSAAGSDPEAVDRWLTALVAEDTDGEPRLGGTSNRLVCKILSMALEDAVCRGRIPRNTVALTQPPIPPVGGDGIADRVRGSGEVGVGSRRVGMAHRVPSRCG